MITYLYLFLAFFKTGLFTIGGGLAALPLLQDEVTKHGWLTIQEFTDMVAVSESTPGPIGINMATYIGFMRAGIPGGIIATLGMAAPSLIIIIIIAKYFIKFNDKKIVKAAFEGIRPAVTGLIAAAGVVLVKASINYTDVRHVLLFFAVFLVSFKIKLHPIIYITCAALYGIVFRL